MEVTGLTAALPENPVRFRTLAGLKGPGSGVHVRRGDIGGRHQPIPINVHLSGSHWDRVPQRRGERGVGCTACTRAAGERCIVPQGSREGPQRSSSIDVG